MRGLFLVILLATGTSSLLHHLIVGTADGSALYSVESDDDARTIYMIQARDVAGAAPSLALDVCITSL